MILLGHLSPDPPLHVDAGTHDHRHLADAGLLRTAVHDRTRLAHGRYLRLAHGPTHPGAGLLRIADHDRTHRGPLRPDDDDARLPRAEAAHPLLAAHLTVVVPLAHPRLLRLSNPTVLL